MDDQTARKVISAFLERVQLSGKEVPAYGAAMGWLARARVVDAPAVEEVDGGSDPAGE